jgi:hypothetical protein
VDQSAGYIERAKKKSSTERLSCDFHLGDALSFICPQKADAGINWYTSFGYSDDDHVNLNMLKAAYASLKPGAFFLLDYTNPAFVFKQFTEHQTLHKTCPEGLLTVHKEAQADLARGMFMSSWHYVLPSGEEFTQSGESRIYFARDLCDLLQSCGFKIIGLKGDIFGMPFSKESPRCIITAQTEHE